MQINLKKTVFSSKEISFIIDRLNQAVYKGYITKRKENNMYLMESFRGVEEKGITPKWNVKIYTFNRKKGGHVIVCVDMLVLGKLLEEDYDSFTPPDLQLLRIDDAGWGFPLCGVMVGITDELTVHTATVPVEYFRHDSEYPFRTKAYLKVYTDLAIELLDEFNAPPKTHRIEICTGYVNQHLREELRKKGYDVRVVEIKGMLQDSLEESFKEYVQREISSDIYYDPKDMKKSEIPKKYYQSLEYGKKHCPHQIKSGWSAING